MSRLSTRKYLQARRRLRRYWDNQQATYSYLSSIEQWHLHDFFKPTCDWTDDEALAHRTEIAKQRRSLPQKAGRALAKIDQVAPRLAVLAVRRRHAPPPTTPGRRTNVRSKDRLLTVLAVMKPEIDMERLARAVVLMAEHLAKQKTDQDQADGPTAAA